jgi:cytochrome c-type biogenesis protein CcmF
MLYTGYIGFSLVFSFAIAGLFSEKVDRNFAIFLKPWLFFSYGFLTLGIGLGAWWAYRELGWEDHSVGRASSLCRRCRA